MRKNLLYVFADQWRYHAMGAVSEDCLCTPNMDMLASESLLCSNALSTYPLCSPHRGALLTGKHPLSLGLWTNCKVGLPEHVLLESGETTITDILHRNGYENAYIGKYHLDASEMNYCEAPESGARNWDAYTPAGERRHNVDFWYSYGAYDRHLSPHYWHDSQKMITVDRWSVEHETDVLLSFLENRDKERPFCAILSWNPPHPPYDQVPGYLLNLYPDSSVFPRKNVPESLQESPDFRKKWREYMAAVTGLDVQLGRIVGYLKEKGLFDDTVLVLSADHGDMLGSHGIYGKNTWYEESIRIPLIVHDRDIPCGEYSGPIVSEDQLPTLLELLGVESPPCIEGKSHLSAILGKDGHPRNYSTHMMIPGMPELVAPFRKKGLDNKAFGWRAIRKGRFKLVVDNGNAPDAIQRKLLYDLKADPYEENPITDSSIEAELLLLLRSELERLDDNFLLEGRP